MVSTYIGSSKFNKNMTFDSISCGAFKIHNYPWVFCGHLQTGTEDIFISAVLVFSALEVCYENALYKFTFDIDIVNYITLYYSEGASYLYPWVSPTGSCAVQVPSPASQTTGRDPSCSMTQLCIILGPSSGLSSGDDGTLDAGPINSYWLVVRPVVF